MKLFFSRSGEEGQPILILHGLFGSGDNWHTHARELARTNRVYVVDQRNHGRSPHSPEMSYSSMVADLLDVIASEGLRDVILVGHSMGGKTVMRFAQEHPFLVERMVVVDMGVRQYAPHHDRIFQGLFAVDVDHVPSRKEAESRLAPFVDDPATVQFLMKNVYWVEEGKLAWRFNLPVLFERIADILEEVPLAPKIEVPALFLKGEKSGYITLDEETRIRTILPSAQFVTMKGSGHWPHAEVPELFLSALRHFIA